MTLRQNTQPPASNLITQDMSDVSVDLSRRLGKPAFYFQMSVEPAFSFSSSNRIPITLALRYGLQFIVSINIPSDDQLMMAFVEKKMTSLLKEVIVN
jgi:hypothetical protein